MCQLNIGQPFNLPIPSPSYLQYIKVERDIVIRLFL